MFTQDHSGQTAGSTKSMRPGPWRRRLHLLVCLCYALIGLLCISTAALQSAEEQHNSKQAQQTDSEQTAQNNSASAYMEISIDVVKGTGDDPMIVIFLESRKGFTKTLYWFSKDEEWYQDLTSWDKKRSKAGYKIWKDEPDLDGVLGPTIPWGGSKTCRIPLKQGKINLLDGNYRLRIEQRKDKGGHYRQFKLPLHKSFKGGTISKTIGYMSKLEIKVKK